MGMFSRANDYLIVVRCPWCGQRTMDFDGRMKDAASDCRECGTRFYNASTICYVPKDKEHMVDVNNDKPLKKK